MKIMVKCNILLQGILNKIKIFVYFQLFFFCLIKYNRTINIWCNYIYLYINIY